MFVVLVRECLVLFNHLDWLECILVPLLECDSHPVLATVLKHVSEYLQIAVAVRVKSAVIEELIESGLLPGLDHLLRGHKQEFCGHELRVSLVMQVNALSLVRHFPVHVLVSLLQLLQLDH